VDKQLNDFKVLTFDCYGTLIDWETGIWDALQPLLMANGRGDVRRRQALEAFGALENRQESETPDLLYPDILTRVHRGLAMQFDLATTAELDAAFANSLPHWPAFPDTAEALRYLKTRYRLVILSNVHRAGFAASNRKLGVEFDAIYTAEDIGSYKPSLENFEYLLEHLERDFGLGPGDILHTAQSLFHDHVPARELGLANAWVDRQRLSEKGEWGATAKVGEMPEVDFRFFSMSELAAAVEDV
jgi:2-haloalkanoic acid dehalogenase type II